VAMEGDKEIFKAIIEPLIVDTVTEGFKKQRLDGDDAVDDVELEELPDPVIQPLNRYFKYVLTSFMCIVSFGYLSLTFVLTLLPWWIICHFSSSLRSPTPTFILQAGLFDSPKKSFFLPVYAEVVAHASPPRRPTCAPRRRHGVDPRVLNFIDSSATVDNSFPVDSSDSGCSSLSGEIFERCSDDSMPTSS
jgi:hypothetical protein